MFLVSSLKSIEVLGSRSLSVVEYQVLIVLTKVCYYYTAIGSYSPSQFLCLLTMSLCCFSSFLQVERCYYFLQACVETAQRKEPVDGRLVQFLLSNPTNDGGQWDMLVNLIG